MHQSSLLQRVLQARGITEQQDIENFLNPDLERDWDNPYNIEGMEEVANAVESALRNGKHILIYGDYDLDGISSTAVMLRGLKQINNHINAGSTFDYFIPSRFDEGYGFSEKSIKRLLSSDNIPEVIISVDCGITSDKEINTLKKTGIEVIVTDHHEKSDNYPKDCALIDPKAQEIIDDNANLAGVGVALKLIQTLCCRIGLVNVWLDLIDLATLGTLGDVMPLIGQNRVLVFEGLNLINNQTRPCIRAILDCANKKAGNLTSIDISYILVPRLNASGRLDKPEIALELLLCDDYTSAYSFAIQLENLNNSRKEITEQILSKALFEAEQVVKNNPNLKCIVCCGDNWHKGVTGIVAAKLVENFKLPSIVMSVENGMAYGSGRSFGKIDLHEACLKSFNKYINFGGHAGACGMTIASDDVTHFSESINNYLNTIDPKNFEDEMKWDLQINLNDLTINQIEELQVLEPFGNKNQEPVFLTKNVFIKRAKAVGENNNHLYCNITDGAYGASGIMFNVRNIENYLKCDTTIDILYNARAEEFRDSKNVKIYLNSIIIDSCENNFINDENPCNKVIDSLQRNVSNMSSVGDFIKSNVDLCCNDILQNRNQNMFNVNNSSSNKDTYKNMPFDQVKNLIVKAFIGEEGKLHDSQESSLEKLFSNKNILSIMPTGRGKSLIFQVYAAFLALTQNKMSIFVYPLRALISDQVFHLQNSLKNFGLNIISLNGETSKEDRKKIMDEMQNSNIDIMLTTPEYLAIHVNEIAQATQVGFIVIDEAHHMGQVKIGDRTAYGHFPKILETLNNPQVIALSATVSDDINNEIQKFLPIDDVVKDNYERANLYVDDRRNMKSRDDYLVNLCAEGQKIVVYVNSRQQTIDLTRMVRSRAPHIAMKVGFYNAGMTREDRNKIETMFRDNKISVLIATSAFGEGVNIPDIRHVCLYHLPFSNIDFNQMSGRCGRDNDPSIIHLLYNRADATINTQILEACNPTRDVLANIFLWIKQSCNNGISEYEYCDDELDLLFSRRVIPAAPATFLCAIDIFSELGIINVETFIKEDKNYSRIAICEMSGKVNLEDSSRFCEGRNELSNFEEYRITAMRKTADELQNMLRHPILPH